MRNFTLKPLLFCTALAGMALQGTIKAQDITFRAAENEEAEAIGVNTSDGVPVVADFDNNGFMDLWAPGQTYEWRPTSEVNEDRVSMWVGHSKPKKLCFWPSTTVTVLSP